MKKIILLFIFVWTARVGYSQFVSASIAIDGLTCSMCSMSVKRSIEKMPFVKSVTVDLNTTTAYVEFQPKAEVALKLLAQQVKKAGFTVRTLSVVVIGGEWVNGQTLAVGKQALVVVNPEKKASGRLCVFQMLDKEFSDKTSYHVYRAQMQKFSSQSLGEAYAFVCL